MAELSALRSLVDRYDEIREYGRILWGNRFYERLYVIRAKIDGAIPTSVGSGWCKDDFSYIDMRILLNIVQYEGMNWAKYEAGVHLYNAYRLPRVGTPRELMISILIKLQERLKHFE